MKPHVPARTLIAVCVIVAVVIAAWLSRDAAFVRPTFWVATVAAHPASAPLIFAAAYGLAVSLFLPTLPLNLVAGALWGPFVGTAVAAAGSVSGAIASFSLARFAVLAPRTQPGDDSRLAWLHAKLVDHRWHGWRVVAFVRLNPIFPGPVNFLFGLTSIPAAMYCWATAVFLIPPTAAFAIIGNSVGAFALEGEVDSLRRVLLVCGAAALFLTVSALVLRRYATRSEPVN